jgi:transcriptional regulator with XRE-family HTH domain
LKNLGHQIRIIRQKKGIGLNTFAHQLGVSPGYLSNLETGKTETVQLSVLEQLQQELHLVPHPDDDQSELSLRIQRIRQLLSQLESTDPEAVNYLLSTMEQGLEVFLARS